MRVIRKPLLTEYGKASVSISPVNNFRKEVKITYEPNDKLADNNDVFKRYIIKMVWDHFELCQHDVLTFFTWR